MSTTISTFVRSGVMALGLLTGVGGPAMTAPLGPIDRPASAAEPNLPIELVRDGNAAIMWPRVRGGAWSGGVRPWVGGNWNGHRAWRGVGNWRGRYWSGGHGHYGHDYDDDLGVVL